MNFYLLSYYKYLLKKILLTTFVILSIIISIVWVVEIINISRVIYSSAVQLLYFIKLCSLLLPHLVFLLIPIAFFCGVWFVFHGLIQTSEIIALKASGASDMDVIKPVLLASLFFTIINYYIAFFAYPTTHHKLNFAYRDLQEKYVLSVLKKKTFNSFNSNTIYFEDIDKEGNLIGLIMIKNNEIDDDSHFVTAKSARFIQEEGNPLLILLRGVSDYKWSKDGQTYVIKSDETKVSLGTLLKLKQKDNFKKPKEMQLRELYRAIRTTHKGNKKYQIEFHLRLIWPYYALIIGISLPLIMLLKISPRNVGKFDEIKVMLYIASVMLFGIFGTYSLAVNKFWPLIYIMPAIATISSYLYCNRHNNLKIILTK